MREKLIFRYLMKNFDLLFTRCHLITFCRILENSIRLFLEKRQLNGNSNKRIGNGNSVSKVK